LDIVFAQKYPRDVRFHAITGDNELVDWYQSRAVCETLGRNLAIIKTDADMADINTTVVLFKLHLQTTDVNKQKCHIGLLRENVGDEWKWYTGDVLGVAWPYWEEGQSDQDNLNNMCGILIFKEGIWLKGRNSRCVNGYPLPAHSL